MPKRRKPEEGPRDRVDLRAEPAWIGRVQAQADRLGIGLSAYIRMVVTRALEADEANDPKIKRTK